MSDLFDLDDYSDNSTSNPHLNTFAIASNIITLPNNTSTAQLSIMKDTNLSKPITSNPTNKNKDESSSIKSKSDLSEDNEICNSNTLNNNSISPYAIEDNIDISKFNNISNKALTYPFELDDFQKRSIIRLEQHRNVLACAHTSSGKTAIAEYGIALGKNNNRRVLYTSPIKALSNQKYREFKKRFGDVGIITGDVTINPDAQCVIMTTEILQSSLYRNSELLNSVEWVIFDEIHYINDNERGHVWEEILILLPAQIGIIMLSATIPNYMEFAQWVGRIKKTTIYVQNTLKRIVPLEHKLFIDKSLVFLVKNKENCVIPEAVIEALKCVNGDEYDKKYLVENDCNEINELKQKDVVEKEKNEEHIEHQSSKLNKSKNKKGKGNELMRKSAMYIKMEDIVNYLSKNNLTPAVIFIFSIKKIGEYSKLLSSFSLINKNQSNNIKNFFNTCIQTLSDDDRKIPQINQVREMLVSGIGIHHSGLLPILKEIIEILYSKGLIKILLATTSFSIGLNMPTRTVVFTDIYKYNDERKEILSSSEYLQMCGRAGRRGIDSIGNVYLLLTDKNNESDKEEIIDMLKGTGTEVASKFRLSYRTIISFFARDIKNIDEFFKESFLENVNFEQIPIQLKEMEEIKAKIQKQNIINCIHSGDSANIRNYINYYEELGKVNKSLFNWGPIANQLKKQGRFIYVRDPELLKDIVVLLIQHYTQYNGEIWCLRVRKQPKIEYDTNNNHSISSYITKPFSKGVIKGSTYDYICYNMDNILEIYDNSYQVKLQVKDADGYDYIGKQDLEGLIPILTDYNNSDKNAFDKLKLINYEKLCCGELKYLQLLTKKIDLEKKIKSSKCYSCHLLNDHSLQINKINFLKESLLSIELSMKPENMSHYHEFQLRLKILQKLDYIDNNQIITLKGKAAREIATTDCIMITEILLGNILEKLSDEEIIAFLSGFASNKNDPECEDPKLSKSFTEAFNAFEEIHNKIVNIEQSEDNFEDNKYNRKKTFTIANSMKSWMLGHSFYDIVKLTDLEEGKLYNLIMRIYLFIEEIIQFYDVIGNATLTLKYTSIKQKLMRGIMSIQSLYLQDEINIDITNDSNL